MTNIQKSFFLHNLRLFGQTLHQIIFLCKNSIEFNNQVNFKHLTPVPSNFFSNFLVTFSNFFSNFSRAMQKNV